MSEADDKLAAAKRQLAEVAAKKGAAQAAAVAETQRRQGQVSDARKELDEDKDIVALTARASAALNEPREHSEGAGTLKFERALAGPSAPIHNWDVVAWAPIEVSCTPNGGQPYTWSASLVFVDLGDGNGYRWCEVSFYEQVSQRTRDVPFALDPNEEDFQGAISPTMTRNVVAFGPSSLSGDEAKGAFLERWTGRFADAMLGKLSRPMSMPIANG